MNIGNNRLIRLGWSCVIGASLLAAACACLAATNVFSTRFEVAEGYTNTLDLVGQNGWQGAGSGGNGLVNDFIAGEGQQAYIGFSPPDEIAADHFFVWKPINFDPLAAKLPLVQFSVLMSIVDSSTTNYDSFRWDVYNAQGDRLFLLNFDNRYLDVGYRLDGTNQSVYPDLLFTNDVPYLLSITMTQSPRPPPPRLHLLGRPTNGQINLRLMGPSGARFAIEASTNFSTWRPLITNVTSGGFFDYTDPTPPGAARRFYRGRWVP